MGFDEEVDGAHRRRYHRRRPVHFVHLPRLPEPPHVLARVLAGAVLGIDAYLVTIEADVASGLPAFNVVGLPQGAVKEGRERVVACMQNSGFYVPPKRITVNLAPAWATKAETPILAWPLPSARVKVRGRVPLNSPCCWEKRGPRHECTPVASRRLPAGSLERRSAGFGASAEHLSGGCMAGGFAWSG
jgi:hypothetical protein